MRPFIEEIAAPVAPEALIERLREEPYCVLLRGGLTSHAQGRYSFVTARPFLVFRSFSSRCELRSGQHTDVRFGNPWRVLDELIARYELLDELDLPFPLGGCFGFWGYDLKHFVEPRLARRAVNDLELPDCQVGFYDSLVVFDHRLGKTWIISTGLQLDGSRAESHARRQADFWRAILTDSEAMNRSAFESTDLAEVRRPSSNDGDGAPAPRKPPRISSNLTRAEFIAAVERAQRYIRAGDIYQVNLAQRLTAPSQTTAWNFYQRLAEASPAPYAAYLNFGDFQLSSSSPELFLRLSGQHILTRPIKGTRPRSADPDRDAQLTYELMTSPKEMSELVMITDLLRNDLGRVCEYGSIQVPELVKLERYQHVQHLVSTVEGRLRDDVTHFAALSACFPGGSITGAPKIRAMEIIDELEPTTRGPYTGCLGYLGFNRESQLSIAIRVAIHRDQSVHFYAGAGIVADSVAAAEYDETLAKAGGFLGALALPAQPEYPSNQRRHSLRLPAGLDSDL